MEWRGIGRSGPPYTWCRRFFTPAEADFTSLSAYRVSCVGPLFAQVPDRQGLWLCLSRPPGVREVSASDHGFFENELQHTKYMSVFCLYLRCSHTSWCALQGPRT